MTPLRAYPRQVREVEQELVAERRRVAGLDPDLPHVGLALSGGGIRSATFCLGVLQVLARRKLLRRIDYLSTVSGGGYVGSVLGGLFARKDLPPPAGCAPGASRPELVEGHFASNDSSPMWYLRQNGRYLSPNGSGDTMVAATVYVRNLAALHVVLSVAILALLFLANGLRALAAASLPETAWTSVFLRQPWPWIAAGVLALVACPLGWAYWLVDPRPRRLWWNWAVFTTGVVLAVALAAMTATPGSPIARILSGTQDDAVPAPVPVAAAVVAFALGSIAALALALWSAFLASALVKKRGWSREARTRWVQSELSQAQRDALALTGFLFAFALVDTFGQMLCRFVLEPNTWSRMISGATVPAFILVFGLIRRVAGLVPGDRRFRVRLNVAAAFAAVLVVAVGSTALSVLAHAASRGAADAPLDTRRSFALAGVALVISALIARSRVFVNNSSQHAIYAARLTRAYVGASNRDRWTPEGAMVTDVLASDEIPTSDYRPHAQGGPLHLINTTINETIERRFNTEVRDRNGVPMAIGPAGISVGVVHHGLWLEPAAPAKEPALRLRPLDREERDAPRPAFHPLFDRSWQPRSIESLGVGKWIAISGAAINTGLGYRTSLALSTLIGLANVRLGYWWRSGVRPGSRDGEVAPRPVDRVRRGFDAVFHVQSAFIDEILGRFRGTAAAEWCLSDGGHFENTACYELLRRRVPLIFCCDAGEDAGYAWTDVANLIRKARIDFGAEIRLLDPAAIEAELDPSLCGAFCAAPEIHRTNAMAGHATGAADPGHWARAHAVLAYVHYDGRDPHQDPPGSVIVFLKPSLSGDEPGDVLEYAHAHPSFPHEPTADQFFDESQWESYRKLGEHAADSVLSGARDLDDFLWRPRPARRA